MDKAYVPFSFNLQPGHSDPVETCESNSKTHGFSTFLHQNQYDFALYLWQLEKIKKKCTIKYCIYFRNRLLPFNAILINYVMLVIDILLFHF